MPSAIAKRRIKKTEKRRQHNKAIKSAMRTQLKKVRQAIDTGDREAAQAALKSAMKRLDKAAKGNIIHANEAARRKSRLQKRVNAL
jgi:small subunit ribosomal protein S20